MTIYEKSGHDSWTATYNTEEMWEWMFNQPKAPTGIIIEELTIINNPVLYKKDSYFKISAKATDEQGTIDEVYADLSAVGGSSKVVFTKGENNTFTLDHHLATDITVGYHEIEVNFVDNDANTTSRHSGIYAVENILAKGETYDTYLINFNLEHNEKLPWNNMNANPSSPVTKTNFTSINTIELPFTLQTTSKWGGQNNIDQTSGNNSAVFSDTVMHTCWYVQNETGNLSIKNLPTAFNYRLTVTGSRDGGGDRTSVFMVNGQTKQFNASHNLNEKAVFDNINIEATGEITLSLTKGSEASYAYLNGMQIDLIAKDVPIVSGFDKLSPAKTTENWLSLLKMLFK